MDPPQSFPAFSQLAQVPPWLKLFTGCSRVRDPNFTFDVLLKFVVSLLRLAPLVDFAVRVYFIII